jgi:hypothetical protein
MNHYWKCHLVPAAVPALLVLVLLVLPPTMTMATAHSEPNGRG